MSDTGELETPMTITHAGERELHERLGRADRQEEIMRRVFRPYFPDQHREFYAQLPFLVMGSVDAEGFPWASMVFGKEGFVTTPNETHMRVAAQPVPGDPLAENARPGAPISVLGIELPTRRRNRMNGIVARSDADGIDIDAVVTFGNCPQHIHTRSVRFARDPKQAVDIPREDFTSLDDETAAFIRKAETFFVASHNPHEDAHEAGGVDVNHRGGRPGFVKVEGDVLTIPDYRGNFAFNTLGNFLVNPKAGLLFVDFDSGDLLYMTGTAELLWEPEGELEALKGAERGWTFTLERGRWLRNASPLRFAFGELSPSSEVTGTWEEAEKIAEAERQRNTWLGYRVVRVVDETPEIRSFYFEREDHSPLLDYKAGQFLTICVPAGEGGKDTLRTYTVSSAPTDGMYRISVKREGRVSAWLHDNLATGSVIRAKAPQGDFVIDTDTMRPAVLIGGGIGITPLLSMARQVAGDLVRLRDARPTTLIHATRSVAQRPFTDEIHALGDRLGGHMRYISVVSQPEASSEKGKHYHLAGRLDADMLRRLLRLDDYDFFLCGPSGFMQSVYDDLRELGVRDARIFAEAFGPASMTRRADEGAPEKEQVPEAENASVSFTKAKVEQPWSPDEGTLLEFAEAHGVTAPYACRDGKCGSCATRLTRGKVAYRTQPTAKVGEDEVLICCAVPAAEGGEEIELEL